MLFEPAPDDPATERLTDDGKARLDSAIGSYLEQLTTGVLVVEGYAQRGPSDNQYLRSRIKASLVRDYLRTTTLKRLASCHFDVIRPAARMARCGRRRTGDLRRQQCREGTRTKVSTAGCREFREQQARCSPPSRTRAGSRRCVRGGATSYLEVRDADTRLFDAELGLAQAELSELSALVEIYRALGGGWQT